jgi:hypothetical protein
MSVIRRALFAACLFFAPHARAQTQSQMIAAAYGGVVPSACVGAQVDLANLQQCRCAIPSRVRSHASCGVALEKLAIAGSVDLDVKIAPQPVNSGAPMTIVVSITNRSRADLPVVFGELAPHVESVLGIEDARHHEVARDGRSRSGDVSSASDYLVVLPAGGVAEWRFPWRAATRMSCTGAWQPLVFGAYGIELPLPLVQFPHAIARGTMRVQ